MKTILLELAQEDANLLAQGDIPEHEVSRNEFVQVGLELEEQQCVVI